MVRLIAENGFPENSVNFFCTGSNRRAAQYLTALHAFFYHPDEAARLTCGAVAFEVMAAHVPGHDDVVEFFERFLKVFDISRRCACGAFEVVQIAASVVFGGRWQHLPKARCASFGHGFNRTMRFCGH